MEIIFHFRFKKNKNGNHLPFLIFGIFRQKFKKFSKNKNGNCLPFLI